MDSFAESRSAINADREPVPKGRLRVAQDVSPGYRSQSGTVPKGRLKMSQDDSPGIANAPISLPKNARFILDTDATPT
jgi:hypothetical protein